MKNHFSTAFVALSAFLAASHHGAAARTHGDSHQPAQPVLQHETAAWVGESGIASYYSNRYNGRRTSSGARFSQRELTAAHAWLPFGTKVRVVSPTTGRSVIVTVTDRLYSARRVLDLSASAARRLGILHQGLAPVSLQPV